MTVQRRILALVFLGVVASLASPALHADLMKVMSWDVDGVNRRALIYSPTSGAGKAPVIFVFHGHGGNMTESAHHMDFQDAWPEAIVVYMQGLPTVSAIDPAGGLPGWQHESGDDGDRDLKFFDAVLATLHEKFSVDNHRVYATGFSNGAIFSYVLWAARANTFAAFAPCSGKIFPKVILTAPKPVFVVAGAVDRLVTAKDRDAAIRTARQLNAATGKGTSCGPSCTLYASTKNANVRVWIHPGGHIYPPQTSPAIVTFFKNHSLAN
jgi:polyhydroxybutyrate depolymerase